MPGWEIVSWRPSLVSNIPAGDDWDFTPPLCLCCRRGCPDNDGPAVQYASYFPPQLCTPCYHRRHLEASDAA